jgi:hypothetical protein
VKPFWFEELRFLKLCIGKCPLYELLMLMFAYYICAPEKASDN